MLAGLQFCIAETLVKFKWINLKGIMGRRCRIARCPGMIHVEGQFAIVAQNLAIFQERYKILWTQLLYGTLTGSCVWYI